MSYRKLLRWNDELPFVKFAIAPDERPVLTLELPAAHLDRDALGIALARAITVCDLLLDDSLVWLHPGAKRAPVPIRPSRHEALLERYADALAELTTAPDPIPGPDRGPETEPDPAPGAGPAPGGPAGP